MTLIRKIAGALIIFTAYLLAFLCAGLLKLGAWMSDREDELADLDRKFKERHL